MKLKANKIVEIWNTLNKLSEQEMPLQTAVKIGENIDSLRVPFEILAKKEQDMIFQYAEKDDNGKVIVSGENNYKILNFPEFTRKHEELFNNEIEVKLMFIAQEELGDIKISAKDYLALKPIIKRKVKNDEQSKTK